MLINKTFNCSHRDIAFPALFYNAVSTNTYYTASHPLLAHCFSFTASSYPVLVQSEHSPQPGFQEQQGDVFSKNTAQNLPAAVSSQAIFSGVGGDQTRARWKLNNGITFIN